MEHLQHFLDLHTRDLDPELFAAALALQYIRRLITNGGSESGRLDLEGAYSPQDLERFLVRAVETAQKNQRFEQEWHRLQRVFPRMKAAWEKGQVLFQQALTRAAGNEEDIEYLSQIDFATDCYAYVSALDAYPDDRVLQAWLINGYMLAWREHFLADDDTSQ